MAGRSYRLSERAKRRYRDIGIYTKDRHGVEQMRFYLGGLLDRCKSIAAGHVPHQSCRMIFADELREDLRFARAGQHFVIFVESADAVLIVDFLHQNADIAGRLGPSG